MDLENTIEKTEAPSNSIKGDISIDSAIGTGYLIGGIITLILISEY